MIALSTLSPPSSTVAPNLRLAAIFDSDAPLGTKISHLTPASWAASAERAKKPEIGWHDVITTPTYSVLADAWMQWHYDTFTAPAGVQILALSDAGPQALQVGRTFATQFHPKPKGRTGRASN